VAFSRSQLPAARAYVNSVFAAGGAKHGRGSRAPGTWSDAYTLRVANVWQRQSAAGRPLSLQEARRGPNAFEREAQARAAAAARGRPYRSALERPKESWVGPLDDRGQPDVLGSSGFYQKTYRRPSYAEALARNLTTDRIQVIGYGPLVEGYAGRQKATGQPERGWRVLFTGDRLRALDVWDDIMDGWHHDDSGDPDVAVFEYVERVQLRWGPAIGD
jgi:hypothetical protein